MNLIVDYGNSSAKVAIFEEHQLQERHVFTSPETLQTFMESSQADYCLVSSVTHDASRVSSWAQQAKRRWVLSPALPLPITIQYATPQTLGVDRIAGVCGAWQQYPGDNSLVIDAGTCITFDFISQQGAFLGGSIAPGLQMRFQAMHTFTAKLPLVQPVGSVSLIGNTTETCMQSGVINGMTAEIEGIISRYRDKYPNLRVILCGGDTRFFENNLKESIFAVPDLVLVGLNSILLHNVRL